MKRIRTNRRPPCAQSGRPRPSRQCQRRTEFASWRDLRAGRCGVRRRPTVGQGWAFAVRCPAVASNLQCLAEFETASSPQIDRWPPRPASARHDPANTLQSALFWGHSVFAFLCWRGGANGTRRTSAFDRQSPLVGVNRVSTDQAKICTEINAFIAINLLTRKNSITIRCGCRAERPQPVVVSNALITSDNFCSPTAFFAPKSRFPPLIVVSAQVSAAASLPPTA